VDVIEIDAATNRGIDEIRELREAARYRPARDRFKIYILDEAHQITDAAFNALLKILEEPPGHVVFMLATTQPEDIPQTIRSRCQHFSFRAVRFEQIVAQLKDLASREKIEADNDALALLAEAGDGSMRDALSIMDQAIASSSGRLASENVRQLVGSAPSAVLEDVMQGVSQGASDEVLRQIDHLLNEGHSPTHFARQMVRFLRNATVAKIAGANSSLLQISADERTRVGRVAELFSEEDLARHLQIMLRTYGELGYRQEQRFHLELGLLKMAHAQRLLPLEQLLSEVTISPAPAKGSPPPGARTSSRTPESAGQRPGYVSPFAADTARKGTPELSSDTTAAAGPRLVSAPNLARVVMGSAAPAAATAPALSAEPAPQPLVAAEPVAANDISTIRDLVLNTLADAGQRMLLSMLEPGEWKLEGSELVIKVAASVPVIDMSLGADAKRVIVAALSGALGRPAKLNVLPGGTPQPVSSSPTAKGGGRGRAEQDPIVRRMKEKFGAEIRTIIDYRDER
jgi:DNA polymerase III subunit gamma/tau